MGCLLILDDSCSCPLLSAVFLDRTHEVGAKPVQPSQAQQYQVLNFGFWLHCMHLLLLDLHTNGTYCCLHRQPSAYAQAGCGSKFALNENPTFLKEIFRDLVAVVAQSCCSEDRSHNSHKDAAKKSINDKGCYESHISKFSGCGKWEHVTCCPTYIIGLSTPHLKEVQGREQGKPGQERQWQLRHPEEWCNLLKLFCHQVGAGKTQRSR